MWSELPALIPQLGSAGVIMAATVYASILVRKAFNQTTSSYKEAADYEQDQRQKIRRELTARIDELERELAEVKVELHLALGMLSAHGLEHPTIPLRRTGVAPEGTAGEASS